MTTHRLPAALLFAAFFVLYGLLAAPYFIGGDHVLFTFVGIDGGYAQAPGYPLFSLLCRLFVAVLPVAPIHATSLGTALIGALAVSVFFKGLSAWGIETRSAVIAAAVFGLMPHVVFMHTQAEVFALNHLFAGLILWACAPNPSTSVWKTGGLGLLAGLALSHHHTIVFLAPLGLWTVYRQLRVSDRPIVAGLLGVAGLLVGLTPYLYLVMAAQGSPTPWHWGDPTTASGLLDIFLRRDFGTLSMTVAEGDTTSTIWQQWAFLAKSVSVEVLGIGLVVAALGGKEIWQKNRGLAWALGATLLLSGPIFVALFHRPPEGLDELLVQKFHLLFLWGFTILIAFGVDAGFKRQARSTYLIAGFWLLIALIFSGTRTHSLQDNAPSLFVQDLWAPLPDNAVLIGTGDDVTAGSWEYLAENKKAGFTIAADLLAHSWYRDQVNATLGISTKDAGEKVDLAEVIDAIHASGRPVFMSSILNPELARIYPTYPYGLTIAMLPVGGKALLPMAAAAENARVFDGFAYDGPENHAGPWATHVATAYASPWAMLANAFKGMGDSNSEAQAAAMRDRYVPREKE